MHVTLRGVSYAYPGMSDFAVCGVDAAFPPGWTGIVGPNGGGKSTIAKIACGLIVPDAGTVSGTAQAVAAYCEQQVLDLPANACDFACDWGQRAQELRRTLGVGDDWAWRFDTLSAGERKRLQIACALALEPDLLALDEPTNFLDAPTRDRVARALGTYRGCGLLVSHDRALLDALVGRCLFVEGGRATMRPGTYTVARAQAQREQQAAQTARDQAKRELARIEREKRRRAEEAQRAESGRSNRGIDPRDSDARAKKGLYIVSGQDGRRGRLSAALDARVAAARSALDGARVEKRYDADVWLETRPSRRNLVADLAPCTLEMGEGRALAVPPLAVGPTEHVGVAGANGAGKSTLVRHLLAHVADDLRTLVIPQEVGEGEAAAVLAGAKRLAPDELGRVLSIVAQLGSRPQTLLQGGATSPGELRKLMLAQGMLRSPELIVMDEPTNHLDIASIEALQRMLAACPCALVLVSHDAPFLEATTQVRWQVERGEDGVGRVRVG